MKSTVRIDFVMPVNLSGDDFAVATFSQIRAELHCLYPASVDFIYAGLRRTVPMHNIRLLTYESPTNVEVVREPGTAATHEHNSGCIGGGILDCDE